MRRQIHRKSRLGCHECKRRHIKCDEARPICAHCSTSQRRCEYPVSIANTLRQQASQNGTRTLEYATPPEEPPIPAVAAKPHHLISLPTLLQTRQTSGTDEAQFDETEDGSDSACIPESVVNMQHLEFLLHFRLAIIIPAIDSEVNSAATTLVVRSALRYPWLMHVLLAVSARHLAEQNPDTSEMYRAHATKLQSQALAIFSAEEMRIDEDNCKYALLFCSVVGRHMLADTLFGEGLHRAVSLDIYCHYVRVNRGLRGIAYGSWSKLPSSSAWTNIILTAKQKPRQRGTELMGLRSWVQESQGLDQEDVSVLLEAIETLQSGLDGVSNPIKSQRVFDHALNWSVDAPERFNVMTLQRLPQALVVLAHYAALLHYTSDLWLIGDSARRFLDMVSSELGSRYDSQLVWLRDLILGPSPQRMV